jgi:hypothetical protein
MFPFEKQRRKKDDQRKTAEGERGREEKSNHTISIIRGSRLYSTAPISSCI